MPVIAAARTGSDDWPHTTRVLPWMLAGFIAMLFLIPFDNVQLAGGGPIDLTLDRIGLLAIGLVWLGTLATSARRNLSFKPSGVNVAVLVLVLVAAASVVVNAATLARLVELDTTIKQVALLLSYAVFFLIATTIVRPSEVRHFIVLIVVLACITAIGTVVEYRTDFNAFYQWTSSLAPSQLQVAPKPIDEAFARRSIVGPTSHGIADATILAMVLPFTIVGIMRNARGRRRWLYALAAGLLLVGAISTFRKTGLVVPAAALTVMLLCRPRQMLRLLPVGIALLLVMQLAAPGALVGVKAQLTHPDAATTTDRKSDYDAVAPDIKTKPLLGRGHGSYDHKKYRFLDNEYLHRIIETGYLGLLAYLGVIATLIAVAFRRLRESGPERGPIALAFLGAAAAYAVANALFDALGFPQAPYVFLLIAALAVCEQAGARAARPEVAAATAARGRFGGLDAGAPAQAAP